MNKNILIILSLVLLITLGLFYTKAKEQKRVNIQTNSKVADIPPKVQKEEKTTTINPIKKTTPHVEEKVLTPITQEKDNATSTLLYESLSIEEASLNTPARKNVIPIGAVHIKQNMAQLQPDDTLTLSDIEGIDYTLTIKSTHENNDGSTSTTADYKDEGITYTTTITQSDKSTYITLSTASGSYEIETSADTGYIYKTIDIRKQLQSRTPDDVIILPIPKTTLTE